MQLLAPNQTGPRRPTACLLVANLELSMLLSWVSATACHDSGDCVRAVQPAIYECWLRRLPLVSSAVNGGVCFMSNLWLLTFGTGCAFLQALIELQGALVIAPALRVIFEAVPGSE